jgi:hypothetical protein
VEQQQHSNTGGGSLLWRCWLQRRLQLRPFEACAAFGAWAHCLRCTLPLLLLLLVRLLLVRLLLHWLLLLRLC